MKKRCLNMLNQSIFWYICAMSKYNDIQKLYYSISEVAEMFGVSNSLIRFWETEFSVLKPSKNSRGDRRFTRKDIENLKIIYHLVKEKGFTLEGAKREIKLNKDKLNEKQKVVRRLRDLNRFLKELRTELDTLE